MDASRERNSAVVEEDRWVEVLAGRGEVRQLNPNSMLCLEGDVGDDVFVVKAGQLHASVGVMAGGVTTRATARDLRVDTHQPGSLVGELSAVSGGHRAVTLLAGPEGATVAVVTSGQFGAFVEDNAEAGALLAERARMRMDRIRVASLFSALLGPTFVDLTPALAERAVWHRLQPGGVIFEEGDLSDGVYMIVSGRVSVTKRGEDGADVSLAEAGRGEVLGELGLLDRLPRTATATALRPTTLAYLPERAFAEVAGTNPGLALAFARYALTRIGHEPVRRQPVVIAFALGAYAGSEDVVATMVAELERLGSTDTLDRERVDQLLGHAAAAEAEPGTGLHVRLVELLHEIAQRNDYVLVETEQRPTNWARSVLDHADIAIVATAPSPTGDALETLDRYCAAVPDGCRLYLLQMHPQGAVRPNPSASLRSRTGADEVHNVRVGNERGLARVARLATGRGTGLVLGGGGARGFAHLGALRALDELDIPVDRIVGASIGAVVGAAASQDLSYPQLVELAERQFAKLLDYTLPVVSILKGKRITENINEQFGGWDIADMWTPFACVTTNLTRSRVEVHREGDAAVAVRASVAIPGVLPPVPWGEDLLVDGGVLNNLPVDVVLDDPSIDRVIAVDVAPPVGPRAKHDFGLSVSGWEALRSRVSAMRSEYPGLAAVLVRSMLVGAARERDRHVDEGHIDLLLDLDLRGVGLLEFDRVREVADRGYRSARPRIEAWLEESTRPS